MRQAEEALRHLHVEVYGSVGHFRAISLLVLGEQRHGGGDHLLPELSDVTPNNGARQSIPAIIVVGLQWLRAVVGQDQVDLVPQADHIRLGLETDEPTRGANGQRVCCHTFCKDGKGQLLTKPPYELPWHAPTRQSNDGLSYPYFFPPGQLTRLSFMPL